MGNPNETSPLFEVLNFAHKLDLMRCYSQNQMQESVVKPLQKYLSDSNIQALLDYAKRLLFATGDRVIGKASYNDKLFYEVTTDPERCLEAMIQLSKPKSELLNLSN